MNRAGAGLVALSLLLLAGCQPSGRASGGPGAGSPTPAVGGLLVEAASQPLSVPAGMQVVASFHFPDNALRSLSVDQGRVVAGVLEQPTTTWGPLFAGSNAVVTSLLVREASGEVWRWRPAQEHALVDAIAADGHILVDVREPVPAERCKPAPATVDCQTWTLLLLDPRTRQASPLATGRRPVPVELTPNPVAADGQVALVDEGLDRTVTLRTFHTDGKAVLSVRLRQLVASQDAPELSLSEGSVLVSGTAADGSPAAVRVDGTGREATVSTSAHARLHRDLVAGIVSSGPDGASSVQVTRLAGGATRLLGPRGEGEYYCDWLGDDRLSVVGVSGVSVYTHLLSGVPHYLLVSGAGNEVASDLGVTTSQHVLGFGLRRAGAIDYYVLRVP